MIYDCFMIYNELEMLKIRLNILSKYVDYFVIVESTHTHSGKPKKLYFKENKNKFKKFLNQIVYIVVDDLNNAPIITDKPPYDKIELFQLNPLTWSREFYQRNCITRGLINAKDSDLILIGDIDEIPKPEKIKLVKYSQKPTCFEQDFYYYFLNCLSSEKWRKGTKGIYKKFLTTPQEIRHVDYNNSHLLKDAGWHFSYLGGREQIVKKIDSFSHQELNNIEITNFKRLKFNIDNNLDIFDRPYTYKIVKINNKYPHYIINNKKILSKFIKKKTKISNIILDLRSEIILNRKLISKLHHEKEQEISSIRNELFETKQTLSRIYNSKTWKISTAYQGIKSKISKIFNR